MFFLFSLLLPILATVVWFRGYPERAARGDAPRELSTPAALTRGAVAGAASLIFLSLLGVVVLLSRGRGATPADLGGYAIVFWVVQFTLAALIGGAVGAVTAFAMLPSVRARLARTTPVRSFD